MKMEFEEYLKSIGITSEVYLKRIETLMEIHLELCQDEIVDIFVDEYIQEDGTRQYTDITFFSNRYVFGAIQFLTTDNFSLTKLNKAITYMKIYNKDYDFKKATTLSRLNLDVGYDITNFSGNFKASKDNCDVLKKLVAKYMVPNL
jgi:hypothetical protein